MSTCPEPRDPRREVSVDDAWIVEWAGDGQRQIERFLDLHAAFDRYLDEREVRTPMRARTNLESDS